MIVELALAVAVLKPLPAQREDAARAVMAALAERHVVPEHRPAVRDALCETVPRGETEFTEGTVTCRVETPCGIVVNRPVFHQPLRGTYTDTLDFARHLWDACPAMLTDGAVRLLVARDRGEDVE